MIRIGWGKDNPMFRQIFTSMFVPGGTHEQADWFNEIQRMTAPPECAIRYWDAVGDINVVNLLEQVQVPTLVMHVREDAMVPIEGSRHGCGHSWRTLYRYAGQEPLLFCK
jgi:hypothetical protein